MESLRYPIWRESLVLRRGLVVAGGFYEWTGAKGNKQAHAIFRADGEPLLMAALWVDDAEVGNSFSIITTPSSEWMTPLHSRMPLILEPEESGVWIDPTRKPAEIKALLDTYNGTLAEFPCAPPRNDLAPKPAQQNLF